MNGCCDEANQSIEVGPRKRVVVDGESEAGVVGGLSQPHIVEGIESCS